MPTLFLFLLALAAASTIKREPDSFYSKDWSEAFETVAIVATNDIHGSVFPEKLRRTDNLEMYTQGGLAVLGSMITTLRKELGKANVMYLDAGDQYQGAIESGPLISNGEILSTFYNEIGLTASTIGNHEFDFPQDFLHNYMKKRKAPFLSSNIFGEKGESAKQFLPNVEPSKIFEVGNGIKIGIVGLTTTSTPQTATGFNDKLYPMYQFREYKPIVLEESRKLRQQGANCVILLSHVGAKCPSDFKHQNRTHRSKQGGCEEDEVIRLINELPKGTIDGVVAGHYHQIVHHYHRGIPIVCAKNQGIYFNVLYLKFDKHSHQLLNTHIEGPVPVCERKFENTGGCDYLSPEQLKGAGRLVNWWFHGEPVVPSPRLLRVFDKWHDAIAPFFIKLADNYMYLTRISHQENELLNLITDFIYDAAYDSDDVPVKPDFSVLSVGALRTTWRPGELLYKDVYAMHPFANKLATFRIKGDNLVELIKRIHHTRWSYGFHNLKVKLTRKPYQVVEVLTADNKPLIGDKWYVGVTTDFLLKGGDSFKGLINDLYLESDIHVFGLLRDHVGKQVKKLGLIAGSRIDPKNPRIEFLDDVTATDL